MAQLIRPEEISFTATVTEDEIRARIGLEVLESIDAVGADGKPRAGVTVNVKRGDSRKGGYTITVTGPMPPRLALLGSST
jgi:hypothetical protein